MTGRSALLLALLLAACATPAPAPEASTPAAASPLAPFPYTADQIRDANPPGSAYLFTLQNDDGTQDLELTRFVAGAAPELAAMQYRRWRAGGPVGEGQAASAPWEDLKRHASFPADQTEVRTGPADTPLGEIPALLYTLAAADGGRRTLAFHQETAGAPWSVVALDAAGHARVERALVGRKDGEARLAWRVEVGAGQGVELNYELAQGARLEGAFSGDGALGWDVHSHAGEAVTIHQRGDGQQGTFVFTAPAAGGYSVQWTNAGAGPVSLLLQVRLQGEGKLDSSRPDWWR
jgi:hypothetical protein